MAQPLRAQQFQTKEYDVTDCSTQFCCCGSKILTLEPEEAVLKTTTCVGGSTKRLPYGDLGSVEKVEACGCCASFKSNLSPDTDEGKAPIAPGCGCSGELVTEIVEELKSRMKHRGNTGNILRAEEAVKIMEAMTAKVDAMLTYLGVAIPAMPQIAEHTAPKFDHKDYDVTDCCHKLCTCGVGAKLLNLEPEEIQLVTTTCCSKNTSRRPYGELGSVAVTRCCGCCVSTTSSLGYISPGCGCQAEVVDEINTDLQERMRLRGDTGNIQRQEDTLHLARQQDPKVEQICRKVGVPLAQAPAPQTMG
jgi:hypothetical protein